MIALKQIWTKSIARQLMLGIALVHAVLMTIFVVDLVGRERTFLLDLSRKQAIGLAETLAANGTSWILAQDVIGMEEIIKSQSGFPGLKYAMFLDNNGKVLSYTDIKQVGKYVNDEVSKTLLTAKPETYSLIDNSRFIDIATPILANKQQIGWARVGISRKGITDAIQHVTLSGLIYTFAAIVIGTIFAWFMGRGLTAGLRQLSRATHGFSTGERDVDCRLNRQDELGVLSNDFNTMMTTIRGLIGEIKEREQNLAITLNSIGDAVIATDDRGDITGMNPVAEQLTGWTLQEAQGQSVKNIFPIIHATTREPIENPVEKVLATGEVIHLSNHTTLISRDGTEYQIADSAAPIRNNKKIIGMVLIFNDVSEQYKLRETAAKSKRDLQAIMDNSPASIYVKDTGGRYTFINQQFEHLFHIKRDSMSTTLDDILSVDIVATMQDNDKKVVETGQALESEEVYFLEDGLHTYASLTFPLFNGDGKVYAVCGMATDITERKRGEEQHRRTEKMDALGKLTGGIAHDYNNMLGVIMGYADLLEDALAGQPELERYVRQINHAGERGAKLTRKLLAFSRNKISEADCLNINQLLTSQQLMLEKTLTVRIQLVFDLAEDLWAVWLDDSDMEDAILNMSINAMHAIEGNGRLTIQTRNRTIEQAEAQSLRLAPGDYVLLSMMDTGCGMNGATREKIFEPFYSTKGDQGTGLGLSQVYGFVDRSGGAIKVDSEPTHGTNIVLYFPRYLTGDCNKQSAEYRSVTTRTGDERILVVDDEAALLDLTCEVLSRQGYQVVSAENGKQAMEILAHDESIDMLLSDILMPEMDGYELASLVREKYPHIKIQLASGFTDESNVGLVDESLQRKVLFKPFNSQYLLQRIRRLLDGEL